MIVTNGRTYLKNLALDKVLGTNNETRKISKVKFGKGLDITTPNTSSLISLINIDDYIIDIGLVESETIPSAFVRNLDGNIGIEVIIKVKGVSSASEMISEMGLFLNDNDESMFSRVIFEPTPFTNATSYKMTYTVYF
jgi:hypothetical protein